VRWGQEETVLNIVIPMRNERECVNPFFDKMVEALG
jgi:hypothetical protein